MYVCRPLSFNSLAEYIFQVLVFSFFFWLCGFWDLVPQPEIQPGPLAVKAQNPSHWLSFNHSFVSDSL